MTPEKPAFLSTINWTHFWLARAMPNLYPHLQPRQKEGWEFFKPTHLKELP
jgi:hypothetical protein